MTTHKSSGIPKVADGAVDEITRALIGTFIRNVEDHPYGDTPLDKIRSYLVQSKAEKLLEGVSDLSGYLQARAGERQAAALEQIAALMSTQHTANENDTRAQVIAEGRDSKREYLSITYSFPTSVLTLLWAMRGVLMDASVRSLSVPDRMDPYRVVTTEDLALALRMAPSELLASLPTNLQGGIDFDLLEDFDILNYGGTKDEPDNWIYGG